MDEERRKLCSKCGEEKQPWGSYTDDPRTGSGGSLYAPCNCTQVAKVQVREEAQWFVEQMELKLQKNDYKGGWHQCEMEYLLTLLWEELNELEREINSTSRNKELIIQEAVDVADFAMMIADIARGGRG